MLFFTVPLMVAMIGGNKATATRFCGEGSSYSFGRKIEAFRNAPARNFAQPLVSV